MAQSLVDQPTAPTPGGGGVLLSNALLAQHVPIRRNGHTRETTPGADDLLQATTIADMLQEVEAVLQETVRNDVGLLAQAGGYVVRTGGKRVRPRVLLLAHQAMNGGHVADAVRAAAAVELLHVASLVHDDINDRSDLRRGQASVNKRWGDGLALLIGDYLFVRLLKLLATLDARVADVLADACTAVVEGETVQMLQLGDLTVTEEDYVRVVSRKTAALFAACGEIGALLATFDTSQETQIAAFREYGLNLGITFQIRDDTLDLVGCGDALGKPVAIDIEQGKMSLATIYATRVSCEVRDLLSKGPPPQPERVVAILRETGAIDYAVARAGHYAERAKAALAKLPDSLTKEELMHLADYAAHRER